MAVVRQELECEQQRLWQADFSVPVSVKDGVKPAHNGKRGGRVFTKHFFLTVPIREKDNTEPQDVRVVVRNHLQRVI